MIFDPEHILRKFNIILDLVSEYRIVKHKCALNAKVCKTACQIFSLPSLNGLNWEDFDASRPFDFGVTRDHWFAFQGDIEIKNDGDKSLVNRFTFSIRRNYLVKAWDDDSPAGPEGRCWLNKIPLTSIDSFHDGSFITEGGHIEAIIFTAHCPSHHVLDKFGVTFLQQNTEILYHRLKAYICLINELEKTNPDRSKLIHAIDTAIRLLDIRDLLCPIKLNQIRIHDNSKKAFYKSTERCLNCLSSFETGSPRNSFSVNVIGYSHLDSCWLWPFSITKSKIINTMTNTLNLFNFPFTNKTKYNLNWKFLCTAPQHLEWIKENDNELYTNIMHRKDRIFIDGAMWIESDTTLSSGETLVRQFSTTLDGCRKQNVLFLPDCFGFPQSIPQLMKLSGVEGFITSKISWSKYTKFPYSTFKWRGIDGSDIFAHFITNPNDAKPGTTKYVGENTAHEICESYKNYKQKNILPNSSLSIMGRGDGGGGIDEEMLWNLEALSNLPPIEGLPNIIFPDLNEMISVIKEKGDELNVWDDELYLDCHQGTLTTQEEVKRVCKLLENYLHSVEWLAVIFESICNIKTDVNKFLEDIWKQNLLFHFHDSITGTSTNQANLELLKMANSCISKLVQYENDLTYKIANLISKGGTICFNTLSHPRSYGDVLIPSGGWKKLPSNIIPLFEESKTDFYERIIPNESFNVIQFGIKELKFCLSEKNIIFFDETTKTVKTPFFIVVFNDLGFIKSVKCTETNREFLTGDGNKFILYEDRPIAYPAWDIQLYHKEMQINDAVTLLSFNFFENTIIEEWRINTESKITQKITFEGDHQITFSTSVNWREHDKLLKVSFPAKIRATTAKFGVQFGHVERPTHQNTPRDKAKYETYGKWADLSDSTAGITICSNIKSGFDIHEGNMMLSLLKAPMQTDKWADYGNRRFIYKVDFHPSKFDPIKATKMADDLNFPLIFNKCNNENSFDKLLLPDEIEFVEIDNNEQNVILETLKPAKCGKGFIARFYEASGGARKSVIKFGLLKRSEWQIEIVDLHESIIETKEKVMVKDTQNFEIIIDFHAFEIVSLNFQRCI